jgi:hypothetical protein
MTSIEGEINIPRRVQIPEQKINSPEEVVSAFQKNFAEMNSGFTIVKMIFLQVTL